MYNIIQRILAPGVLFTWTVICATYLRFHYSIKLQRQGTAIPVEARSSLQPYLALFGLTMSAILSTPPSLLPPPTPTIPPPPPLTLPFPLSSPTHG